MNYPLDLRNINVTYPDGPTVTTALDTADLQVPAGQVTALVGESGSGKSTLLSVGAGLVVPDSGSVRVAGTDLTDAPDSCALKPAATTSASSSSRPTSSPP